MILVSCDETQCGTVDLVETLCATAVKKAVIFVTSQYADLVPENVKIVVTGYVSHAIRCVHHVAPSCAPTACRDVVTVSSPCVGRVRVAVSIAVALSV